MRERHTNGGKRSFVLAVAAATKRKRVERRRGDGSGCMTETLCVWYFIDLQNGTVFGSSFG